MESTNESVALLEASAKTISAEQWPLVLENLGMVYKQANRWRWHFGSYRDKNYIDQCIEELVQFGIVGLCVAAARFDQELGHKFSTYAYYCIKSHVIDGIIRSSNRIGCVRSHKLGGFRRGDPVRFMHYGAARSTDDDNLFQVIDHRRTELDDGEDVEWLKELKALVFIGSLDARRARFVWKFFVEEIGMKEIGQEEEPAISKERVRQIIARGLQDLRCNERIVESIRHQVKKRREQVVKEVEFAARLIA